MSPLQSILLGLIEGITEFLPISSTFHLIFAGKLFGIPQTEFTNLFSVFIQSGAILSVLLLYRETLRQDTTLLKKVLLAYLPTATIGFFLYKIIKNTFFESDTLTLTSFILIGALFILYELHLKKNHLRLEIGNWKLEIMPPAKSLSHLTYPQALLVGLIQATSVLPGVSRAGAVILAMMFLGFKRSESAKFSFLLSIPTIFSASLFDLYQMRHVALSYTNHSLTLALGFLTAFISSWFIVKWLIQYLQNHTLLSFGLYRIALGIFLFIFLLKL